MKKKMIALLAGALMALSASSAFAAFADLDLVRVVYARSGSTIEVATELGNVKDLIAGTQNISNLSFSSLVGSASDLYVAYFAKVNGATSTTGEFWITGDAATKLGSSQSGTVKSVSSGLYTEYNSKGGTSGSLQVLASTADANSWFKKANGNGGPTAGKFGGAITTGVGPNTPVEASLANLANGPITQDLYYFANFGVSGTGEKVATLTTNSDGTTSIAVPSSAAPVPIPAAAYLLGSGLLGLVGIRRKNKNA